VVQVRSFSKTYGVCGWRIGYVATEANLSRRVADWQAAVLNPPNTPAQLALAAAPSVPAGFSTRVRSEVHERVLEVHRTVSEAGLRATLPEGGFYVWADVRSLLAASGHDSTLGWCEDLARRNGLGLWPGEDYLAPGWVRVAAVAASDPDWRQDVIDLRERLESFMSGG
jgi:aspartate/methionine/tyrosine aminotransferase